MQLVSDVPVGVFLSGGIDSSSLVAILSRSGVRPSTFSTLVVFVIALWSHSSLVALMTVALTGAILGFLRFNFNPATIFLGDSGSLFIGFLLSALALEGAEGADRHRRRDSRCVLRPSHPGDRALSAAPPHRWTPRFHG